jgi:hypothetical protein
MVDILSSYLFFFFVCLTTMSIALNVQRCVVGVAVNNVLDSMWNEAVVA